MKVMLHFIKETSSFLTEDLALKAKAGEEFELKESFGKFSLDTHMIQATYVTGDEERTVTSEKCGFYYRRTTL